MATILVTVLALGVAVALLYLRILLVKDGEFRGTCSSNNPMLRDKLGPCVACGKKEGEVCPKQKAALGLSSN